MLAKQVALGGTKERVATELGWFSPTCECEAVAANDREVCVCTRPGTRCEGKFTVETYAVSTGGSSPWMTGGPPPKESTTFTLPSPELLFSGNVLLFALDKDDYVALVLAHKFAPGDKRTLRPLLLFGSLAPKIVTRGYDGKTGQLGAREDYQLVSNAARRTVQLSRKGKNEFSGKFNLAGPRGTPTPAPAPSPGAKLAVAQPPQGPAPTVRGMTENEIRQHVQTSFRTTLVANGFTAEVMTINQSGRHLAFASLDRAARSVIVLHDMDKKSTTSLPLPFKDAAVLGMALVGGWTKTPPTLGAPRAAATRLYVAVVSPGGRSTAGLYQYDLAASPHGPPKLALKGSFAALGADPTGQELVALSRATNPQLSVFSVAGHGALALKYAKKVAIGDAIGEPAFSKDRAKIFVSALAKSGGPALFATDAKATGPAVKVMDGIGPFSVGRSGKDVLVVTKWTGTRSAPDGKLYALDLVKKSLRPWLDCRGAACRTPTVDPVRDIAYFSVEKTLDDGTKVGAICSNGDF